MKYLFLLIFSIFISACTFDNNHIKKYNWLYGEGYYIGDWIDFKTNLYQINKDTIYKNKQAVAFVYATKIRLLHADNLMVIQSLDKKEKGIYFEK